MDRLGRWASVGRMFAAAVLLVGILVACSPLESKGTMPPPGPNGEIDSGKAPDFIAVAGRDGSVAGLRAQRSSLSILVGNRRSAGRAVMARVCR